MSSSQPTVLIFTYAEHGQSNVTLATSYELALVGVNVHIASFASLNARVTRLQELIDRHPSRSAGKTTGSVILHECKGVTPYAEALYKQGLDSTNLPHPPGVSGALQGYSIMDEALFPCSQEEYLNAVRICQDVITTIKPNVVVIDPLFYVAMDGCKLLGQNFMIIYPTGLKEAVINDQPYLAASWKYPIACSGFPFPLKWWQIPLNIYLYIRLIIQITMSVKINQIGALRKSLEVEHVFASMRYTGVKYICPTLPEIDFPFAVIPQDIVLCGPIVLPFKPLEESDPGLMMWLDNGPTVLINLGTHVVSNDQLAREVIGALRILLDHHAKQGSSKIQVLWKVKTSEDVRRMIDEIIGEEIKERRVNVVAWLDTEPISILQHPNVVCTVHHGGANSFYEGVWSGIPHIVLPVWYDTYDYANRAEYLNIGIFASKTTAPGVGADEFGKALVKVTGTSEEAAQFRASARRLRELCRTKGNGRELAAAAILKEIGART